MPNFLLKIWKNARFLCLTAHLLLTSCTVTHWLEKGEWESEESQRQCITLSQKHGGGVVLLSGQHIKADSLAISLDSVRVFGFGLHPGKPVRVDSLHSMYFTRTGHPSSGIFAGALLGGFIVSGTLVSIMNGERDSELSHAQKGLAISGGGLGALIFGLMGGMMVSEFSKTEFVFPEAVKDTSASQEKKPPAL